MQERIKQECIEMVEDHLSKNKEIQKYKEFDLY